MAELTLLSKMGFADADLSTPLHDEIPLWLDDGLRNGALISKLWPQLSSEPQWQKDGKWALEEKPITALIWQKPIVVSRDFIIGYIDLFAHMLILRPCISDYSLDARWEVQWMDHAAAFDVVTRLPALGKLVRRIQTYRRYWNEGIRIRDAFVVCPDDRFAAPLAEQGIKFLKYER